MLEMLSTRDQPWADPDWVHYTVPTCAARGHGPTCCDHQGYLALLPTDLVPLPSPEEAS